MRIENEQTTTTEYTLAEAAGRLGWAGTTLRDKATANAVPHHRRHAVRGIFFTQAFGREDANEASPRPIALSFAN